MEKYFEDPSAENVFREARGTVQKSPAAVISKAFLAGLHPPEFKLKGESKLDIKRNWNDKRTKVLDLVREVAIEWRTVELADKQRHQTRTGRPSPRGTSKQPAGDKASTEVVTCVACKRPGHLACNCPRIIFL